MLQLGANDRQRSGWEGGRGGEASDLAGGAEENTCEWTGLRSSQSVAAWLTTEFAWRYPLSPSSSVRQNASTLATWSSCDFMWDPKRVQNPAGAPSRFRPLLIWYSQWPDLTRRPVVHRISLEAALEMKRLHDTFPSPPLGSEMFAPLSVPDHWRTHFGVGMWRCGTEPWTSDQTHSAFRTVGLLTSSRTLHSDTTIYWWHPITTSR